MIEDEAESLPASAPTLVTDEFGNAVTIEKPAKKKGFFRWLLVGSALFLLAGIDAIAFVVWGWEALELVAIEILVAILLTGIYFLVGWIQTRSRNWMEEVGWPGISGLCVLATVGFFVAFVGGPALGQTLGAFFGGFMPGTAIVGVIAGYAVWSLVAISALYGYNRLIDGGSPSKGVIAVTIALPILAIAAFFGFGLIEAVAGSFAKVWLLYAILAAILTAIFVDQSNVWETGVLGTIAVVVAVFAAACLISWAILSAVGATFGMFGQGATILAVALAYGIYLSWERSSRRGGP